MNKSLTFSGYKLQGKKKYMGMDISIENKKGSIRKGKDKDGHKWKCKMHSDYGYIKKTVGKDKDHLDCYLGPNKISETVFVVHQNDPVTKKYDEDKVMLGFNNAGEAKKAYTKQYDHPGFYGSMTILPIEKFKEKIFSNKFKESMVKSQATILIDKSDGDMLIIKSRALPVGTIRYWKGRRYQKQTSGEWTPYKEKKVFTQNGKTKTKTQMY